MTLHVSREAVPQTLVWMWRLRPQLSPAGTRRSDLRTIQTIPGRDLGPPLTIDTPVCERPS